MKDILRGVKTGIEMVKQYAMRDLPLVLVQLVTCCLVFVSYDLVQPLLYTVLFDSISSADFAVILKGCLGIGALVAVMLGIEYLNDVILDAYVFKAMNASCIAVTSQYHRLPYYRTMHLDEGDVYNRINQGGQQIPGVWGSLMMTLGDFLGVGVMLILCFRISPCFVLADAVLTLLILLRMKIQAKKSVQYANQQEEAKGLLEQSAYRVVYDMEFAAQNGIEEVLLSDYQEKRKKLWRIKAEEVRTESRIGGFYEALNSLIRMCAPFLLLRSEREQSVTYGAATSTFSILDSLQETVPSLSGKVEKIAREFIPIERLQEMLGSQPVSKVPAPSSFELVAQHVSLNLGAKEILHDLSFSIEQGEKIALIGRNGCGKSTLLRVMMGLLQPSSGTLCVGGIDVTALSQEQRRACFSFAPAVPQLFSESVQENILMGANPDEGSRIHLAVQEACLESELLVKGGLELSGGQALRTDLARALIHRAPVLILDEPTAALDKVQRAKVMQTITSSDATVIVATHDSDTVALFDRVLLLDEHRLVAEGTPEQVRKHPAFQVWMGEVQAEE